MSISGYPINCIQMKIKEIMKFICEETHGTMNHTVMSNFICQISQTMISSCLFKQQSRYCCRGIF